MQYPSGKRPDGDCISLTSSFLERLLRKAVRKRLRKNRESELPLINFKNWNFPFIIVLLPQALLLSARKKEVVKRQSLVVLVPGIAFSFMS